METFSSKVLENSSDLNDGIVQIFDAFCLIALNSLKKTSDEDDINNLKAKAAPGKIRMSSRIQP